MDTDTEPSIWSLAGGVAFCLINNNKNIPMLKTGQTVSCVPSSVSVGSTIYCADAHLYWFSFTVRIVWLFKSCRWAKRAVSLRKKTSLSQSSQRHCGTKHIVSMLFNGCKKLIDLDTNCQLCTTGSAQVLLRITNYFSFSSKALSPVTWFDF